MNAQAQVFLEMPWGAPMWQKAVGAQSFILQRTEDGNRKKGQLGSRPSELQL